MEKYLIPIKQLHPKQRENDGHAEIYLIKESAYLGRILIGDPHRQGEWLWTTNCFIQINYTFLVRQNHRVWC